MKLISRAILILALAIGCSTALFGATELQREGIERSVKNLDAAIKSGEVGEVEGDLSDRFSLSVASLPLAKEHYLYHCLKSGAAKSVEFESFVGEGDIAIAYLLVETKGGEVERSKAGFDEEGKLLFFDFYNKLYGSSFYDESKFVASIPFEVDEGFIFVRAKVNGGERELKLLFDTGSDGIALDPQLKDELGLSVVRTNSAVGPGGESRIDIVELDSVEFDGGLKFGKRSVALFPGWSDTYDGLVGISIFRNYIIKIDNRESKIELYTLGDYQFEKGGELIDISASMGLVELPGKLNLFGDNIAKGNFVMDSGAMSFLLCYQNFVRKNKLLLSGFEPESMTSMGGLGGTTTGYVGKAAKFSLGESESIVMKDMPVVLQASSGGSTDDPRVVDGSIGIEFLTKFNIVIDLLRKKAHFIPLD